MIEFTQGDAAPDTPVTWCENGAVVDLVRHAVTARVGQLGQPAVVEKVTGFVLAATAPNLIIRWTNADLATVPVGTWVLHLRAVQPDGRARSLLRALRVGTAVG